MMHTATCSTPGARELRTEAMRLTTRSLDSKVVALFLFHLCTSYPESCYLVNFFILAQRLFFERISSPFGNHPESKQKG
jgi:hypothetical protein